jgi:hypothetical protein
MSQFECSDRGFGFPRFEILSHCKPQFCDLQRSFLVMSGQRRLHVGRISALSRHSPLLSRYSPAFTIRQLSSFGSPRIRGSLRQCAHRRSMAVMQAIKVAASCPYRGGWPRRTMVPAPLIQLSFLFLRVNRVPVSLISFRNRFLALAPTIT